jgi:hypothetical protein
MTGALEIIGGTGVFADQYIRAQNGFEMGGALNLQHGEFQFNDTSTGVIGGLYSSVSLAYGSCAIGFDIQPTLHVVPTLSGASGIQIMPLLSGAQVGIPVVTRANHHYQLQTVINARNWARYDQIFRSLGGNAYGGDSNTSTADITWIISDIDMGVFNQPYSPFNPPNATTVTSFSLTGVSVPSFMLYAPANWSTFNLTANFTQVTAQPQAGLYVRSLVGPTGSQLPNPSPGLPLQYLLGFGLQNQTATIGQSGDLTSLQFYQDTIPAVGARIRLQAWEAGHAMARVNIPSSIEAEAVTTGDDGLRTAVLSGLKPTPRTSTECEYAAQAFLVDRSQQQYNGSYDVDSLIYWDSREDYPRTGRYISINSPGRDITNQEFLVRRVTTVIKEWWDEVLGFSIEFGQDNYLDKFLRQFIQPSKPVLQPRDVANPPTPQEFADIGSTYLGDLNAVELTAISGSAVTVNLGVIPITGAEIRRIDSGWGRNDQNRVTVMTAQTGTLPRLAYDQTWYIRQLNGGVYSRNSKVIRVVYPLVPVAPDLLAIDITDPLFPLVTLGLTGDIRNIRGVEIRASNNTTVLYQRTFTGPADLVFRMDNSVDLSRTPQYYAYFFNLLFEYSPARSVTTTIAAPVAPVIDSVDNNANILNVNINQTTNLRVNRTEVQTADDSGFTTNLLIGIGAAYVALAALTHSLPMPSVITVITKFIRARRHDPLGPGAWSTTTSKSITIVPPDSATQIVVGTLAPDQKPSLTLVDANRVFFYATDFDHLYRWTGTDWFGMDWNGGMIGFFDADPGVGWALANGAASVPRSTRAGAVGLVNLPNMIGAYIKGSVVYSPAQQAEIPGSLGGTVYGANIYDIDLTHNHALDIGSATPSGGGTSFLQYMTDALDHAHYASFNHSDFGNVNHAQIFYDFISYPVSCGDYSSSGFFSDCGDESCTLVWSYPVNLVDPEFEECAPGGGEYAAAVAYDELTSFAGLWVWQDLPAFHAYFNTEYTSLGINASTLEVFVNLAGGYSQGAEPPRIDALPYYRL